MRLRRSQSADQAFCRLSSSSAHGAPDDSVSQADPERQHRWGRSRPRSPSTLGGVPARSGIYSERPGPRPIASTPTICRPISGGSTAYTRPRRLVTDYGDPAIVRFRNNLPANSTSGGENELTIHLHNGHTASESDGFAGDFFGTGLFKDNHYANAYAGIDAFGSDGVAAIRAKPCTLSGITTTGRRSRRTTTSWVSTGCISYTTRWTRDTRTPPPCSLRLPGILRHNRHPSDPHRQEVLRHRPSGRTEMFQSIVRARRRQMDCQRQDSAEDGRQKAQVPLPDTEHRAGKDLEPQAGRTQRSPGALDGRRRGRQFCARRGRSSHRPTAPALRPRATT